MNRFFILISFLFFGFSASAQWFPFPLGQKSFFQYLNSTINIYYVDSVVDFGTHQIYHFDYSTPDYNGCYEAVNHDPNIYPGYNIDRVRPDSIIKKNDSLLLAFSDGYFYSFSDSILFLPTIKKDSSWFSPIKGSTSYNSLKFTCDNIFLDTIIGNVVDSVKLISIQSYYNSSPVTSGFDTLQLILSKNYGFKQFVSFFHAKEIPLIGLDSGFTKAGFELPQFSTYFHLSVGDIIIWKRYDDPFDIMIPNTTNYYKDSITSVSLFPDSVFYYVFRTYDTGSQSNLFLNYYKNKFKALTFSTSIYCTDKSINNSWGWGQYEALIESSPIHITYDSIINRNYGFNGMFYDTTNCSGYSIADAWGGEQYNTYYGLTSHYVGSTGGTTTFSIVGSIINGVQIGNVWNVGLNEITNERTFEIYPNPNNGEQISIAGENLKAIEILNLQGQLILKSDVYDKITPLPIISLAKGIYFVKALFKTNKIVVKKLVIN